MNRFFAVLVALVLALSLAAPVRAADPYNPKPAQGDLTLPMPGGGSMVFRPVYIGEGNGPFAQRKFMAGDPFGGFKEHPTSMTVGGAFLAKRGTNQDWLYYMGKYEVTEGQYYSVMGLPQGASKSLLQSAKPITGLTWFDANQFVDKYNKWLFENARGSLPDNSGIPGFVRLPSEAEWEFAARGGAAVSADDFDRRQPYKADLTRCEWFAGPKSSHNKLKGIGLLQPNPLGLYDMLGNASEMTHSLYQVEYYQGRSGGFTARGGHYFTSEKKLRSSMRSEEPFYIGSAKSGLKPNAKPTMGLRLMISSVVFANRNTVRQMADDWEAYRKGMGADLPAAVSVGPASKKTGVTESQAMEHLRRLKEELGAGQLSEAAKQEMGRLEAALGDIRFIRRQAEEDSAFAWAKISGERGYFLFKEMKKLPTIERLKLIAEKAGRATMVGKYETLLGELNANVKDALATLSDSYRQLDNISPDAVAAGFDKYTKFLVEHQASRQLRVLKLVREQYNAFNKEKRADQQLWMEQFKQLGQAAK